MEEEEEEEEEEENNHHDLFPWIRCSLTIGELVEREWRMEAPLAQIEHKVLVVIFGVVTCRST